KTTISAVVNNTGTFDIRTGTASLGSYTQTAGSFILDGGAVTAGSMMRIAGGKLVGTGTITGSLGITGGTLAPGFGPGSVAVTGDFSSTSTSHHAIEIGGHTAGVDFDRIDVSGNAILAGTLDVTLTGGFTPALGDTFPFMTYGSRSGSFGIVN